MKKSRSQEQVFLGGPGLSRAEDGVLRAAVAGGSAFKERVEVVAAAGRVLASVPRCRGRQGITKRYTYGAVLDHYGISQAQARLWQDVAEAEPRLDDYMRSVEDRGGEPTLKGLVAFAKNRPAKVLSEWDKLLRCIELPTDLIEQVTEAVEHGQAAGLGIPDGGIAVKLIRACQAAWTSGLAGLVEALSACSGEEEPAA